MIHHGCILFLLNQYGIIYLINQIFLQIISYDQMIQLEVKGHGRYNDDHKVDENRHNIPIKSIVDIIFFTMKEKDFVLNGVGKKRKIMYRRIGMSLKYCVEARYFTTIRWINPRS